MKNYFALLLILLLFSPTVAFAKARQYDLALPGYKYSFPKDHGSHDNFKTEWWYYTGNLKSDTNDEYGFELTFFRAAIDVEKPVKDSIWSTPNLYMAHFAISDIKNKTFLTSARLKRPGPQFAGSDAGSLHTWNLNWTAKMKDGEKQKLYAKTKDGSIELELEPEKPLVLHGLNGVSQKASALGHASHYYSFTRLKTSGYIHLGDKRIKVTGSSWMDHEFGSNQLDDNQIGWDWFSIQLQDGRDLMLYLMRLKDGSYDPASSGTLVMKNGTATHLYLKDFQIESTAKWRSEKTKIEFPSEWKISIPSLNAYMIVTPKIQYQEFIKQDGNTVTYWEGACSVQGTASGVPCKGDAYVELTGYGDSFKLKI